GIRGDLVTGVQTYALPISAERDQYRIWVTGGDEITDVILKFREALHEVEQLERAYFSGAARQELAVRRASGIAPQEFVRHVVEQIGRASRRENCMRPGVSV